MSISQLPYGAATLPLSVADTTNPANVADPINTGNAAFVANFKKSADFGPANPRNPNSKSYGAFPSGMHTYNTYLK